jgi:hypothetical protein
MEDDKSAVLSDVCAALTGNQFALATDILRDRYPFVPLANVGRRYNFRQMIAVFMRDGFVDRYSGARLVFPARLRLISKLLPEPFPFHRNGRLDLCHFAFWASIIWSRSRVVGPTTRVIGLRPQWYGTQPNLRSR